MQINFRRRSAAISGLLLAICLTPALAQTGAGALEEIVVTAQFRQQSLQEVPVSVVAVTGDMIAKGTIQKIEDLQYSVPSLTMTETGIGTNMFIRGIGSGINQGFEQSVGVYIDGVHYGRAQQTRAPFLDLERVEVLRGPQSTLFGKNSVAGALNISTARPTSELDGYVRASHEFENNEQIFEAAVSGPLSERVRGRLTGRYRELDGYIENITLNRDEPNREDWTLRGILEADITDDLTASLKIEVGSYDVLGRHLEIVGEQPATAGPFTTLTYAQILGNVFMQDASVANNTRDGLRSSNGDFSFNDTSTYVLTLDWQVGEHELKSITSFSEIDYRELCDCDFTGADVFTAALQEKYDQISQEIRLTSPIGDGFDYIVGGYLQKSDHDFADQILISGTSVLIPAVNGLAPGFGSLLASTQAGRLAGVEADIVSAFGQFNWHFNEKVTLQLGLRVTKESKDGRRNLTAQALGGGALPAAQALTPEVYAGVFRISTSNASAGTMAGLGAHPVSGSRDETKVTPDAKLLWFVNDDTMLYASYARGFKSGGFDFRANNRGPFATLADSFEFDDEQADSFELGGKFTLAGGTVELNAAAFYTEFDDLQVSIFDGTLGFNVGNAATAKVVGLELDGRLRVNDYWSFAGALAFTDFEFTDFRNGQCYFGRVPDSPTFPGLCDYTGQSQQMVADVQGNIAAAFSYPVASGYNLDSSLDLFFSSNYNASSTLDPALEQGSYTNLALRVALAPDSDSWEVALLAKNLTDEDILMFGGDTPLAGSSFGAKSNYAFYQPGRTIALQGTFRF